MAEYTLTLKSEDDFRIISKLLRAFEGASIRPKAKKSELDLSIEEMERGEIVGPFTSMEDLMKSLLS